MFIYFYQNLFLHFVKKEGKKERKRNLEKQERKKKKLFANFLNVFRCFWFSSVLLTPIIDDGNEKKKSLRIRREIGK